MQQKNWIFFLGVLVLLGVSLVVLKSSASDGKRQAPSTCCKKSQPCRCQKKDNGPGELIMEDLSHQFISITPFTR